MKISIEKNIITLSKKLKPTDKSVEDIDNLKENKNILIDLSLVSYIDSSGVASLVEGYQIAKKQSLKFGLFGVSDAAMSVLKLARLDQVFPIYNSKDEYEKEDV